MDKPRWVVEDLVKWQRTPSKAKPWLLRYLLPQGSIIWISGPRKRGFKTWMAFALAMAAASGKDYQKHIRPVRPLKVLVIEEEGTIPGTKSRMRKLQLGMWKQDTLKEDPYDGRFLFVHHAMCKLDSATDVTSLIGVMKEEKVDIVLFDAITYMHNGDENKASDMRHVTDSVMKIRNETGATVIGIVHTKKPTIGSNEDMDNELRGSTVMLDVYDGHFALRRHKETDELFMMCRYREHGERTFNVHWDIKECDNECPDADDVDQACKDNTCTHLCSRQACMCTAKLRFGARSANEAEHKVIEQLIMDLPPANVYSFAEIKKALGEGYTNNRIREIIAEGHNAGYFKPSPSGKGFVIA